MAYGNEYPRATEEGYGYSSNDGNTVVMPAYDEGGVSVSDGGGGYERYSRGSSGYGSTRDGHSHPKHAKPKKRHPFLKFLAAVVAVALIAWGALTVMDVAKSDEQRMAEYTGSWQLKAAGNAVHPVLSAAASLFVSGNEGVAGSMTLGIVGDRAQMGSFGVYTDYAFSFDKGHFALAPTLVDGLVLEGDQVLGWLVVKDATGSMLVYEKVSDAYEFHDTGDGVGGMDAQELLDAAKDLAGTVGGAAEEVLENVDVGELQGYLDESGLDAQQVQGIIANADPVAIMNGDLSSVPELQGLIDGLSEKEGPAE